MFFADICSKNKFFHSVCVRFGIKLLSLHDFTILGESYIIYNMGLLQDKLSKFRVPQMYMERGVYP